MFIIIIDTREKLPFDFSIRGVQQEKTKLDTGDYAVKGLEHKLCIDRKVGAAELYSNVFQGYARFKKELLRMQDYERAIFVVENPYQEIIDFPESLPKRARAKVRFSSGDLVNKIEHIRDKYGVEFIFCEGRGNAQDIVFEILRDVYHKNKHV